MPSDSQPIQRHKAISGSDRPTRLDGEVIAYYIHSQLVWFEPGSPKAEDQSSGGGAAP